MAATDPSTRPLRADARRNREAILDAARRVIGRDGLDAQVDDIAREAGVGVGTFYRHFPTKDVLVDALTLAHFQSIADAADAAEARMLDGEDAWTCFAELIAWSARRLATDLGLSEVVSSRFATVQECGAVKTGLNVTTERIIARAIADGTMRADATVADIPLIMAGLAKVSSPEARAMGHSWERYLELMLDGLRARPS
jgi:AcrR family transcriptional regulator